MGWKALSRLQSMVLIYFACVTGLGYALFSDIFIDWDKNAFSLPQSELDWLNHLRHEKYASFCIYSNKAVHVPHSFGNSLLSIECNGIGIAYATKRHSSIGILDYDLQVLQQNPNWQVLGLIYTDRTVFYDKDGDALA